LLEGWEQVRELRGELRAEWAELWRNKYDDAVRAEDVSAMEFEKLFVDCGEVIFATRDYKPLSFREILERHLGSDVAARVEPDPAVGGWRKFAREHLKRSGRVEKRERPQVEVDLSQHQRKGGHGWLNKARKVKRIRFGG
jgi:hypothetical protein